MGGAERSCCARCSTSTGRAIVEVDGRETHGTARAFESDRRRDQRLALLDWRVIRFSWRQVTYEPAYVTATLRGLLSRGRAAPARGC